MTWPEVSVIRFGVHHAATASCSTKLQERSRPARASAADSVAEAVKIISAPSEGEYKEKGSKFLGFAYPIESEEEIKIHIQRLQMVSNQYRKSRLS